MALLALGGVTTTAPLKDAGWLAELLPRLAERIGMHAVGEPIIQPYSHWPNGAPSGVLFLEESAITIHTYPEVDFIEIVLHSCKPIERWGSVVDSIVREIDLDVRFEEYLGGLNWRELAKGEGHGTQNRAE